MIGPGIREAHDRVAGEYGLTREDGTVPEGSFGDWVLDRDLRRPLDRIFREHLGGACSLLLDAGCGNGQVTRMLLGLGVERVLGVDFSPRMLREARRRLQADGLGDRFIAVQGDVQNLAMLASDKVDAALLFGVMEHLDRPGEALAELLRVIRPGGHLVVSVTLRWSVGHLSYLLFGQSPRLWGIPGAGRGSLLDRSRYYRFYPRRLVPDLVTRLGGARILERVPIARFYLDGRPGALLHRLARRPDGYRRLDRLTRRMARIWRRPGAEFLVIRKDG